MARPHNQPLLSVSIHLFTNVVHHLCHHHHHYQRRCISLSTDDRQRLQSGWGSRWVFTATPTAGFRRGCCRPSVPMTRWVTLIIITNKHSLVDKWFPLPPKVPNDSRALNLTQNVPNNWLNISKITPVPKHVLSRWNFVDIMYISWSIHYICYCAVAAISSTPHKASSLHCIIWSCSPAPKHQYSRWDLL